ncbi:hypothetical protein E4T47_06998 [Aureobasidium subglaciale]|nr:hypothetical protein E4T47_06998 [Aureobasidium subglaciale]
MTEWLIDLFTFHNDPREEELAFELWCQFDVTVNRSTVSRLLKNQSLTNKVNTRIASRRDSAQQGVYQERLAEVLREGVATGAVDDPAEMLSLIGHPAFTTSKLVSKTRCLVLPALDINGHLPGTTLVVEGAIT